MKRLILGLVVASGLVFGVAMPSASQAQASLTSGAKAGKRVGRNYVYSRNKKGELTRLPVAKKEAGDWRKSYGAYKSGKGRNTARDLQRAEKGKRLDLEATVGGKVEGVSDYGGQKKLDEKITAGCGTTYKVLAGEAALAGGIMRADGKPALSCNAGVEGTLAKGGVECIKILSGDANNGVNVGGSGNAGAAATLTCMCEGPGLVCEAFIGLKADADGKIGGAICGLKLALGLGGEVGAGAGGKAQIGYVKGKGYGFALAGYVGVGAGAKVYVDPDLNGLLKSDTYTCLFDKAKGVWNATVSGLKGAANRLAGLFTGGKSSGGGVGSFLRP